MEEQPVESIGAAGGTSRAVHPVARHRMTDRVEVHADLVRSPGDQVELQQGPAVEPFADPIARDRRPPVGDDGHPRAVLRVAPDRCLDASDRRRHRALHQRLVRLADAAGLELRHERGLRAVLPGHHQQPARVAVKAMDDPGPLDAGDPAVLGATGPPEQGVDHRPRCVARRRMHDEAGGLVDDQQVVILVHHVQRDVRLGRQLERLDRRDVKAQLRARVDDRVGAQWLAAGRQPSARDELLDVAPGEPRRVGHDPVGAAPAAVRDAHRANPDGRAARPLSHRSCPLPTRRAPGTPPAR